MPDNPWLRLVKKRFILGGVALLVVAISAFLAGCTGAAAPSSSSQPSSPNPPGTVHAANGFTNASVIGSYAFQEAGVANGISAFGVGVVVADGNGTLTSGDETVNVDGIVCHSTFNGTYSVNSNGTGNATITATADAESAAKGCGSGTADLKLAIGNGGNVLYLIGLSPLGTELITAVKQ